MTTTTETERPTGIALEPVTRFIVHCSRCNTPFKDEDLGFTALWTQNEFEQTFPANFSDWDDAQGWIRIGDRILDRDCWEYADEDTEDERRVECGPLPADKADKVASEQETYRTPADPDQLRAELAQTRRGAQELGKIITFFAELIKDAYVRGADDPVDALQMLGNVLAEISEDEDGLSAEEFNRVYQALEDRRAEAERVKAQRDEAKRDELAAAVRRATT